MKYSILDLSAPINTLNGVGIKTAEKLNSFGIKTILDLLFYFPINIINRKICDNIPDLEPKTTCVIKLTPIDYLKNFKTHSVICKDSKNNSIELIFFKLYPNFLEKYLPLNKEVVVIGNPDLYRGNLVIHHPEKFLPSQDFKQIQSIDVVYKAIEEITSNKFKIYIQNALHILNNTDVNEWLDVDFLSQKKLPSFKDAINEIHNPKNNQVLNPLSMPMLRLAIDEILSYQLILIQARSKVVKELGIAIVPSNKLIKKLLPNIPFKLTQDQIDVIKQSKIELAKPIQSSILLQGDVGCGKTIVCFILAIFAIENGYQVAFMAPTEILAQQHYDNFKAYQEILGIKISLLKAKDNAKNKKSIIENVKNGDVNLLVGTHALFQDAIVFHNLGLVVVDEQHRFGVNQRLSLLQKGNNPNLILTTATPIPRTLALAYYGDITSLEIKNKPANRKEIITKMIPMEKMDKIMISIKSALAQNKKIFWVCPAIEESENHTLSSINARYDFLKQQLGLDVDLFLLHGKQKSQEKEEILIKFKATLKGAILIGTTVIEVGIDIPSCNIMIVENADRFGLAQLHQLRGRVGRGNIQGVCLLLYPYASSINTKNRLSVLVQSNDGFYIANKDLELRGFGDVLGTSQSGSEYLTIANLDYHGDYLLGAIKHAKFLLNNYEENSQIRDKLKHLLFMFQKYQDFYMKV
jgi:ATP-dependent DNA helicase RecG